MPELGGLDVDLERFEPRRATQVDAVESERRVGDPDGVLAPKHACDSVANRTLKRAELDLPVPRPVVDGLAVHLGPGEGVRPVGDPVRSDLETTCGGVD